jgi:hypothetical protein
MSVFGDIQSTSMMHPDSRRAQHKHSNSRITLRLVAACILRVSANRFPAEMEPLLAMHAAAERPDEAEAEQTIK